MPDIQHKISNHSIATKVATKNLKKGVTTMKTMRTITMVALVLIIGLVTITGERQCVALQPDYASGVNSRNGDASPAPGYSAGETNSRIDDYINQDEQINLDVKSGLVKVLRTNQKTSVNDYVEAVIQCKNVNPRELRGPIRTLVRKEGGDADVVQDKVKGEYFLHVTCPRFQLPYVEAAIRALDEKWVKEREDGSAELYYQAKFRDAADILNITQFYRGPEGTFNIDPLNNALYYHDQPGAMALQKYGLKNVDIPPNQVSLDVAIYEVEATNEYKLGLDYVAYKNGPGRNLFYGLAQEAHLRGHYTIRYPGYPSYLRNTVHLDDLFNPYTRYRYGSFNLVAAAAYVDYLVSRGKAKLLTKTNVLAKSGTSAEVAAVQQIVSFVPAPLPAPPPPPSYTMDDKVLQEMLELLKTIEKWIDYYKKMGLDVTELEARRDKILKILDEQAIAPGPGNCCKKRHIPNPQCDGEYIPPYPEALPMRAEYAFDRVVNYVKSGSIGVRVNILPFVGLESTEAAVDIAVSDVVGHSPQGTPIINTRFLFSYVRMKDGVPYVIGGIKRKEVIKSTGKIPLLGDLPVLGWLAGNEQDKARETELVIVLTPRVILSSESKMEMPQEAETVIAQVEGKEKLRIPTNPFGFDQWLLDSEK
ncbi:hypothetical protein J7M23_03645 [Candidatus Sumerlaeota bacterium]|nr:hypothetical protein [Candidatus Sumerlaeota bacterium]